MQKSFTFLLLCALIASACSKDDEQEVLLRIKNVSNVSYSDVYVNTGGGDYSYGSIEAGHYSEYRTYDYVGESKLDEGRYTYITDFIDTGDEYFSLTLDLEEN